MPPISPPTKARPSRSALAVGAAVDATKAVISVMKSKLFIAIVLSCEKFDFVFGSLDEGADRLIHSSCQKLVIWIRPIKPLIISILIGILDSDRIVEGKIGCLFAAINR